MRPLRLILGAFLPGPVFGLLSFALLASILGGCRREYVVLSIDTTMGVPCDLDQIQVEITGADSTEIVLMDPRQLPGTLTVERGGDRQIADVRVRGTVGCLPCREQEIVRVIALDGRRPDQGEAGKWRPHRGLPRRPGSR